MREAQAGPGLQLMGTAPLPPNTNRQATDPQAFMN